MMKISILLHTLLLLYVSALPAQDSTFTFEEICRYQPELFHAFYNLLTADLNGNGIKEIITTQYNTRTNYHKFTRFENGEILNVGTYEYAYPIGAEMYLIDFNRDGLNDVYYTANPNESMIYFAPDYELGLAEHYYFGKNKVTDGGNRRYPDGTANPVFLVSLRGGPISANRIVEGTWENGEHPQYLNTVCRGDFITREINGETVYFATGGIERHGTHYYMLYTSLNRGFETPDSLIFQDPGQVYNSGVCFQPIVVDMNGDNRLDWLVPYWEEISEHEFNMSVFIYDPDSLVRIGEFRYEGTENDYVNGPYPIRGVAAVDVNGDDVGEIMLVVQNEPIRIIDLESLEVIMTSDYIVPDEVNFHFSCGHFDDSGQLQVLLQDDRTTDFIIYNLPEGWRAPPEPPVNSIEESKTVIMPGILNLLPAYPNPFNSTTRIGYQLPEAMAVEVTLLDMTGRQIGVLEQGLRTPGHHQVMWDANTVPSGTYYIQLKTRDGVHLTKASLVK